MHFNKYETIYLHCPCGTQAFRQSVRAGYQPVDVHQEIQELLLIAAPAHLVTQPGVNLRDTGVRIGKVIDRLSEQRTIGGLANDSAGEAPDQKANVGGEAGELVGVSAAMEKDSSISSTIFSMTRVDSMT